MTRQPISTGNVGEGRYLAVFLLTAEGRVLACNVDGVLSSPFSRDALSGGHFVSLYASEDTSRAALDHALESAAQGQRCVLHDVVLLRPGNDHFNATVSIDPLRSGKGEIHGLVVTISDNVESCAVEEPLRDGDHRFRLFVNAVTDHAICMIDTAGMIIDWNPGAQRLTHFRSEAVEGQPYGILFCEQDRARDQPRCLLERAVQTTKVEYDTHLLRGSGREYPARLTLESIRDSRGALLGFACILRDISAQRAMERHLLEACEQAAHARKLEAFAHLTGGIAHDFNNALQGIISSLEIASVYSERQTPEKASHYLSLALESAQRAGGLTQRLLGMTRRQDASRHRTSAEALLTSLRDVLPRVLGDHIALQVDVEENLPLIACDSGQLESVLLNLAIRARDAMHGKGTLILRVRLLASSATKEAGDNLAAVAARVEISVIDDGVGPDDDVAWRSCPPSFATHANGQDTVPGLAMMFRFVDQHGGTVDISRAPGRGICVSLCFPCVTEGDAPSEARTTPP